MDTSSIEAVEGVPAEREVVMIDVRELAPPEPLTETMEAVADLSEDELLVQVNDRVPQHLFPRLEEHGLEFESVELDDYVLTGLWKPATE